MVVVGLIVIGGQAVYWLWLRDDERDDVVWRACLYPGEQK
jgi:hypothetical protein